MLQHTLTMMPVRCPKKDTLGSSSCHSTINAQGYTLAGTENRPKMLLLVAWLTELSMTMRPKTTPEKPMAHWWASACPSLQHGRWW